MEYAKQETLLADINAALEVMRAAGCDTTFAYRRLWLQARELDIRLHAIFVEMKA